MPTTESHLPRAASLMRATSRASWSAFRNAVTGADSFVSLSTITAIPTPQLGWQPQLNWPQSACGPCTRSLQSEKVDMKENREPVADRLAQAGLVPHVVRQVRERVALGGAPLVGDGFVAAGEGDRLEGEEG